MSNQETEIAAWTPSTAAASDEELLGWLKENEGEKKEIPWDYDSSVMVPFMAFDNDGYPVDIGNIPAAGIEFGGQNEANFSQVTNWVQVDNLGGLGALYCGSYGGKFYLRASGSENNTAETIITEAEDGEELGMTPAFECTDSGFSPIANNMAPLPREACPIALREKLLKVDGKWRSDVYWDILINGTLCPHPPGVFPSTEWDCDFRYFTLRLVQVGRYICFHTCISTPNVNITKDGNGNITDWSVEDSKYYNIGYSSKWHGLPRINYGNWFYSGFPCADGTAEPPWGKNISESWQGDTSEAAAAATVYDGTGCCGVSISDDGLTSTTTMGGYPYCRVFHRVNASTGWRAYYDSNPSTNTSDVESMSSHLFGVSPEWVEERLGISDPHHRNGEDWKTSGVPDYSVYRNLTPAAEFSLVFDAHLPLEDKGYIYLAFYAGTIDNCLLTASICSPYGYTRDAT